MKKHFEVELCSLVHTQSNWILTIEERAAATITAAGKIKSLGRDSAGLGEVLGQYRKGRVGDSFLEDVTRGLEDKIAKAKEMVF